MIRQKSFRQIPLPSGRESGLPKTPKAKPLGTWRLLAVAFSIKKMVTNNQILPCAAGNSNADVPSNGAKQRKARRSSIGGRKKKLTRSAVSYEDQLEDQLIHELAVYTV